MKEDHSFTNISTQREIEDMLEQEKEERRRLELKF